MKMEKYKKKWDAVISWDAEMSWDVEMSRDADMSRDAEMSLDADDPDPHQTNTDPHHCLISLTIVAQHQQLSTLY